jgi:hypothetical protein
MDFNGFKFLLFFFFLANFCSAQINILMLNGKYKPVKQYEVKGDWIYYKKIDDPKDKTHKMDKFDVFSAINADSTEEIIYDPDTTMEGDPGVEQVRNYIKGEQYGMAVYKKPLNIVGGVAVGAGSAWLLGYYGPIGVFTYAIVLSRFNPKVPYTDNVPPEVFNSAEFSLGYQKYARNKKIKQSLIFGGISFGVAFAAFAIFDK